MIVDPQELRPGLVLYLDPAILEQDSRTETVSPRDASIRGPHFFLLLPSPWQRRWLTTPLYSRPGRARLRLDPKLKGGPSRPWHEHHSYLYRRQLWVAPISAIVDASIYDTSPRDYRNTYAVRRPDVLRDLALAYHTLRMDFGSCRGDDHRTADVALEEFLR
jgi:hypothetical protein